MNIEPLSPSESEDILSAITTIQDQIIKSLAVPQSMLNDEPLPVGISQISSIYKLWWLKDQILKLSGERTRLQLSMVDYAMEVRRVMDQLPLDFINREETAAALVNGFEDFLQGIAK